MCQGQGLRPEVLSVYIGEGENRYSILDIGNMTLADLSKAVTSLKFDTQHRIVASRILETIKNRIRFLEDVGLGYLTMNRRTATLSGGEAQRIRLASQIGSGLTGVLYVLDEPSIGLHQRDNDRLIASLEKLRDLDNTLVVVEHDEEAIRRADFLIDMGPGAGEKGGRIVAAGTPAEVIGNPNSLTGRYLSGELTVPVPAQRRQPVDGWLKLLGASGHNLKNVNLEIPLGLLTVVTGVSGSGKSSLITQTLYPKMAELIHKAQKNFSAVSED
ncbi:excinuclease ABC, A subunit [gut metagenome]|uniref:Excinuclease ABC, A subunit n=1 Tax=gut metagenome TaxID=749906 RepID=J9CFE1_9ZZZZ